MRSVPGVNRVVEIHASQHREHVGLQESDQKLEAKSPIVIRKGSTASSLDDCARSKQHDDERAKNVKRNVACEHVGEQTHRMTDRADKKENTSIATTNGKM